MKKSFILLSALMVMMTSCYTSEDQKQLQQECKNLYRTKVQIENQITSLNGQVNSLQNQIRDLRIEKNAFQSGRSPRYIVKFKIKQGTFTLDIFEHVKNEMNSIEIEVPVDKGFYDKLSIGQDITDSFKWGSLVMDGDFSTLHMKVIGKRVE